jgi:hypothetical protein
LNPARPQVVSLWDISRDTKRKSDAPHPARAYLGGKLGDISALENRSAIGHD